MLCFFPQGMIKIDTVELKWQPLKLFSVFCVLFNSVVCVSLCHHFIFPVLFHDQLLCSATPTFTCYLLPLSHLFLNNPSALAFLILLTILLLSGVLCSSCHVHVSFVFSWSHFFQFLQVFPLMPVFCSCLLKLLGF